MLIPYDVTLNSLEMIDSLPEGRVIVGMVLVESALLTRADWPSAVLMVSV